MIWKEEYKENTKTQKENTNTYKQTDKMSVVQPSAEIKPIIEKTATFVAKHGDAMEQKILSQDKSSSKLSFLHPQDPLNPYYRQLVLQLRESAAQKSSSETASSTAEQGKSAVSAAEQSAGAKTEQDKGTKSVPAQTQPIKPPAKDRFTMNPPNLSPYEM